ncbi:MAG: DUF5615 family PIN-like protein [Cyanobacteria bacterium P01_E01_bin.45]
MKLLFDQNLSPSLTQPLQDIYPDSNHVFNLGLDRATDVQVWDYARQEGFVIVTKDSDFSDLSTLRGFPPKVIWIRRGNCRTSDIEAILRSNYQRILTLVESVSAGVMVLY